MKSDERPLILHVIHQLATGGLENGLVNLINHLPESKFRHAIACVEDSSDFSGRIRRKDTRVIALYRSRTGTGRLRRNLFHLCRQLRPAIVHSRNQSGLDALLPARLAGVRHCIHGEHGWDVNDLDGRRLKPALLRWLHSPLVDHYIAVSRELRCYLIDRLHIAPRRVTQIVNGVDTERFSPPPKDFHTILPDGFVEPNVLVIGTVGRVQAVKDQETLLRAFAALVGGGRSARLVIVGEGPLRSSLQSLAESLGVGELTWFPGNIDQVPDVLRSLDVFVLPSLAEGISNTLLEAMATGLPLLATSTGGNLELVVDDVNGRLFAPRDVAKLTELLCRYLDDRSLLTTHGAAAREIAVQRFSLSTMIASYQAVYDEFCARR